MKTCSKCKIEKSETNFYKWSRSSDGLQPACKQCMGVAYTTSRNKNKAHYNTVRRNRAERNRTKLMDWKKQQTCSNCSENDPVCLDLHHLDPTQKDVSIADVVAYWSWGRLTKELRKCIVVCANCHRKLHSR